MSVEHQPPDTPRPAAVEAAAAPARVTAPVPASAVARSTVPAVPGGATLVRARAAVTQLLPHAQYQIARLGPAGQTGLAALVAALVLVVGSVVPAYRALETLNADLASAQHPSAAQGLDQAVPHLISALPTRAEIPAVVLQVVAQAKEAGVSLDSGRYVYTPAKSGTVARYDFEFPVKASYPDIRKFIDRTLTAVPAAALSRLHVERKTVGDPLVNADIGFVVFVRS